MLNKFVLLLVLTAIQFSCSKEDAKKVDPDIMEELVLLEFNTNIGPGGEVPLLPQALLHWSLKNANKDRCRIE